MGAQHVNDGSLEVVQQKTGTRLLIPIHECLKREIEFVENAHPFLQTSQGRPFRSMLLYAFQVMARGSRLPDGLSPHGLRKTAARRLAGRLHSTRDCSHYRHASLAEVQRYTRAVIRETSPRSRRSHQKCPNLGGKVSNLQIKSLL